MKYRPGENSQGCRIIKKGGRDLKHLGNSLGVRNVTLSFSHYPVGGDNALVCYLFIGKIFVHV